MANFCIPISKAQALKEALSSGKLSIQDLLNSKNGDELISKLEPYVGDQAKSVATLFEEKLILKNRTTGLKNFIAKATQSGKYSPEKIAELKQAASDWRAAQQQRIFSPEENQMFLSNIAERTAGTRVSLEQANKIGQFAKKVNDALNEKTDNPSGVSDNYLKAASDYRNYVNSLQPVSGLQLIVRNVTTTMRNFLLMNPSTPLKTLTGQLENSILDKFTRRAANLSLAGDNAKIASDLKSQAWKTYKDTGLNTASMNSLDDTGKLGEGHRFDLPKGKIEGGAIQKGIETATRKAAAITNKVAIDWEHNILFTKFHQSAFYDTANLLASKFAQTPGESATILKDAARIEPQTEKGAAVRAAAQYQAGRVTGVGDTYLGNISSGLVRLMDSKVPGSGSFLFQIVKIPTNIIGYGVENAGGGLFSGPVRMLEGRKMMESSDLPTQYKGAVKFAQGTQTLIRTVGVMTAALMLTSTMNKNSFKTDRYGDTFVRIGNTWINTEYFYLIAPAIAGFMDARSTKDKSLIGKTSAYGAGAVSQLKKLPLVDNANTLVTDLTNPSYTKGVGKYLSGLLSQRMQPAFIRQLEQAKSPQDVMMRLFFSTTGLPTNAELSKLGAQ